jgi:hypothetical protein
MKITTWDEMKLVVLGREMNVNKPETSSIGFCKVYNSIEECIEDGEDPNSLIIVLD